MPLVEVVMKQGDKIDEVMEGLNQITPSGVLSVIRLNQKELGPVVLGSLDRVIVGPIVPEIVELEMTVAGLGGKAQDMAGDPLKLASNCKPNVEPVA